MNALKSISQRAPRGLGPARATVVLFMNRPAFHPAGPGSAVRFLSSLAGLVVVVSALLAAGPAHAQDFEHDDLDEAIEQMDRDEESHEQTRVPPSSADPVNVNVHWRQWQQSVKKGDVGADSLEALAEDAFSLGHRNLPTYATAVYHTASTRVADGDLSVRQGTELIALARQLAPDVPYPELALGAHLIRHDLARLPDVVSSYLRGLKKGASWLDTRLSWELKLTSHGLVAFMVATLFFVLAQLLRYFGIIAYDLARLLPRGFSSNQTVILLVALIVVPGLLLQSPLLSLVILLTAISLVQRVNERLVTLLVFAVLAALPYLDDRMSEQLTWPQSDTQQLTEAQYLHCRGDCLDDLDARWTEEDGDDPVLAYTLALAKYRRGEPQDLDEVVELLDERDRWTRQLRGPASNLIGAAHVARARPDEAIDPLEEALRLDPESPAPALNLMRAHQMNEEGDPADEAFDEAIAVDVDAVRAHMKFGRRDVNGYLLVEPLPAAPMLERHRQHTSERVSLVSPIWSTLSGPRVPLDWAPWMGALGALIALASLPLYLGGRASSPCPKCGLARDPQDSDKTGHHRYCLPCYHTFVSGASLHYDARVHNERVLGRRERFQDLLRRILSVITPGGGHAQAGHGLGGFLLSLATAFGIVSLMRPLGLWRPPYELFSDNWGAQLGIAWVLLATCAFFVLSAVIRGISPTEVAHDRSKRRPTDV